MRVLAEVTHLSLTGQDERKSRIRNSMSQADYRDLSGSWWVSAGELPRRQGRRQGDRLLEPKQAP
jgi:hypothetical protein